MRTNKIVLAISGVAALCLVGAVFLSAGEVGAEPADDTVGSQPARGLSYVLLAIPVLGGCGGFISYDQPVWGVIEPGRESCFEFEGSAGDMITARMTRADGDLDPLLKLWGPNGLLASDDNSDDSDTLIANFMLPENGSYALLASGFDAFTSGGFELLLTRAEADPTPTTTPAAPPECGGQVAHGETVEGSLTLGSRCEYVFTGRAGDLVTIALEQLDGQLDPYLELLDPERNVEASDDDGGGNSNSLIQDHRLLRSGKYTIVARAYQDGSAGFFRLSPRGFGPGGFLSVPLKPPPPPCGGQIAHDELVEGSLTLGSRCEYIFTGRAGDLVTITLEQLDGQFDPYIELLDPEGNVEASDDDGGGNSNSLIQDHRLLRSGKYTIVARAYQDRTTGRFQLSLRQTRGIPPTVVPPPPPPPAPCGGDIQYGHQDSGIITSTVLTCTFSFSGRQGDLVTLRVDKTSGNLDPVIELLAPSNNRQVVVSNDDAYGNNSVIWRYRLTEGGRYQIRAHSYRNTSTGGFKLLLTEGLFRKGNRVQIIYSGSVNIRQSPGSIGKTARDILAEFPSGTVTTVVGGPTDADGLKWWQVEYQVSPDRDITGWMAEKRASGQILLAPAFQP